MMGYPPSACSMHRLSSSSSSSPSSSSLSSSGDYTLYLEALYALIFYPPTQKETIKGTTLQYAVKHINILRTSLYHAAAACLAYTYIMNDPRTSASPRRRAHKYKAFFTQVNFPSHRPNTFSRTKNHLDIRLQLYGWI